MGFGLGRQARGSGGGRHRRHDRARGLRGHGAAGRVGLQVGDPGEVLVADADLVVHPQGCADIFLHELLDRRARDPAHDLAREIADVDRVVGPLGLDRPGRRLDLQRRDHPVVMVDVACLGRVGETDPAIVRDDVPDLDVGLAVLGELRPVLGDRRFEVDQPPICKDVHAGGAHTLGDRIHDAQRVLAPGLAARGVHMSAPEIDHFLAVMVDRDRAADLVMVGEVSGERLANA